MAETILDHMRANLERRRKHERRFRETFGCPLKGFWSDNLTGFDVIRFDDWVKPRRGESTKDAVRRRWGDAAVAMLEELIKLG